MAEIDATAPHAVPQLAIFTDFDGTLVEIAETPDAVEVPESLADQLQRAAQELDSAFAVLTGREIADIDRYLAPLHLPVAGAHGTQRRRADGVVETVDPAAIIGAEEIAHAVSPLVMAHPGLLMETKEGAVAVHFRQAPELEAAVRIMMPVLFLLLLLLLAYAAYAGDFAAGVRFLFSFHPEDLSLRGALIALGHAFFTLSLGMAAIMAYGAYMPSTSAIGKTAIAVALLDTTVALVAGLAIFPLVFATPDITPSEGPGVMFVTLPIAFGAMPWGSVFGSAFFALVILAAWSSTISLLEPSVAYLTERFRFHRISASLLIALAAWLLGLGTVFSFNIWVDKKILWDLNFFGLIDFITTNVMLPLGGLLTAIYVGWRVNREFIVHELKLDSERFVRVWHWLLRYVSPLAVMAVLFGGLYPVLKNFFGEL